MPLYEYVCRDCGRDFEYLTRQGHSPSCPSCASQALDKQLSTFAVSAGSSQAASMPAASPCGACGDPRGPGSCRVH